VLFFEDGGSEGKPAEAGGRIDVEADATHVGCDLETGAGPSLVLFFNLSTLFECFCAGAPVGRAGLAAPAVAHPLELEVAPCMPLSPGKLG
jgi:hypothetical protein